MERAAAEIKKLPGIPLRSAMYFVLVPPNLPFDRQLALDRAAVSAAAAAPAAAGSPEPAAKQKSGGFGGFMKKLGTVALEASKKLDKGGQSGSASTPPQQSTLVVMTDEVKRIDTNITLGPAMFAPPNNYREVRPRTR